MQPASAHPHFRLSVISPPYQELQPVSVESVEQISRARFGTLACIEVLDPGAHWIILSECIREMKSRCLSAPILLRIPECGGGVPLGLVRRAGLLRIRAVLCQGNRIYNELHAQMTDPVNLGEQVSEWLSLRIPRLPVQAARYLRHCFDACGKTERGAYPWGIDPEPDPQGVPALRKAGLPPSRTWRRVARALRAALAVQADPRNRLADIAAEVGYSEQASMSNQIYRSFRLRPRVIRGTLGWEWLMDRWCATLADRKSVEDLAI